MGCRSKIKTLFSLSSILLNLSRLFSIIQRGTSSKRDLIEMKTRGGQKWYLKFWFGCLVAKMTHFCNQTSREIPLFGVILQPNFKGNSLVWGAKPSKYCPIVLMGRQTFQVLPNCLEMGRQTFQVLPNCLEMGRQTFQVRLIYVIIIQIIFSRANNTRLF